MIFFAFPFAALLLVLIHFWFYRRLCRPFQSSWLKWPGIGLIALSFFTMATGLLLFKKWPSPLTHLVQNIGYVAMVFGLYLAISLVVVDVIASLTKIRFAYASKRVSQDVNAVQNEGLPSSEVENFSRSLPETFNETSTAPQPAPDENDLFENGKMTDAPENPDRRQFFLTAASLTVATSISGFGGYSAFHCPVKTVEIFIRGLSPTMDGFTIALLSDLHAGGWIGRDFIQALVNQTNAFSPDAVLICGDLVDGSVTSLKSIVAPVADFKSGHGTFFTIGNHEIYSGVGEWCEHLKSLGIHVLRNQCVPLADIDLVGADDWTAARRGILPGYDLKAALKGRRQGIPAILLTHQPRGFQRAAEEGIDLQLSGHTHGGQLSPFQPLAKMANDGFLAGLYRHGKSQLYVTRGCGFWGPPARVGAPPEITKIRLRIDG